MQCNVGNTEKIIRFVLGLVFVWVAYTYSPWWYLVAAILIVTAAAGFCPLTSAFGVNTCKPKEEEKKEETSAEDPTQESVTQAPAETSNEPEIESWKAPTQKEDEK